MMSTTPRPDNLRGTNEYEFPRHGTLAEKLKFLVTYAVLAPSIHNTQPWKFTVRTDEIRVLADLTRHLKVSDPDARELYVSVGCAIENLLVAAAYFGLSAKVTYFPDAKDESWVATISFAENGGTASLAEQELFHSISLRHTNRQTYANKPLNGNDLQRLRSAIREAGVAFQVTDDNAVKEQIDALVVSADISQFADPAYRDELNHWVSQGEFGYRWLIARIGQLATTYLASHHKPVKPDADVVLNAPLIALISTITNDRLAQIKAGQVFERIALHATALNLGIQPLSQILQVSELKPELGKLFSGSAAFPQMAFRLGYTDIATWESSRKQLDDVITK